MSLEWLTGFGVTAAPYPIVADNICMKVMAVIVPLMDVIGARMVMSRRVQNG